MAASWKLRQVAMLAGLVFCSITNGYIFGQMSGMLDALYSRQDGIYLTDEQISWIASSVNMTTLFGFALAALITEKLGRKRAITFFAIPIIINWILIYFAEEMILFMISRIFVGVCFGGLLSMYIISTAEYTSPKIRGLFLTITTSVGPAVGTGLGHIFGILFHWRTVALVGIIPTAFAAILPLFSEESPPWLASKGRYEECDKAFRRLHGNSPDYETELKVLKEIEKGKKKKAEETTSYVFKNFITAWKKSYFWKVLLLSSVINVYLTAAGKLVYSTLAVTMLENITGSKDILFFTTLVDGFVILGACFSCVLVKKLKMRTLLFSLGIIANMLLIFLSGFMYLFPQKGGYYAWVSCITLALFFIVVNAGPYPVLETFMGEIFPLELKAYCFFLSGIVLSVTLFLSVKLADDMFKTLGYHGTFLINAAVMTVCLFYFWFKLPESKGRTLQEIELYFKNNSFDEVEKVLNGQEVKVFI